MIDGVEGDAHSVALAVVLGRSRTLVGEPYTMTHAARPAALKRRRGVEPGGVRVSARPEDLRDRAEDLRTAFEQI